MTSKELIEYELAARKVHRELMAQPRRCPQCQVAWAAVPAGFCTYKQVPVWSPPEDLPASVCYRCAPPDWSSATQGRLETSERLDQQDEEWDAWMRKIEAGEYETGEYTDDLSPDERRIR